MKRLIAIMLCVISILSILSVSAFAAEDPYIEYKPWAGQALEWAIEEKVTAATGWADFRPAKELSRAEVVTFLYAYKGKPENNGNEGNPFCDINPDDWWYDAAIWAYYKGYVAGGFDENGNRCFMPNTKCTYAHLVTMLYALAGKPFVSMYNHPYDVSEDEYYYKPLKWCKRHGIIDNIPAKYFPQGGNFNPDVICTRVIFVTMLYNFHKIDTKYISPRVLRMIYTAESKEGHNYTEFTSGGNWCDKFVEWAAGEAGLAGDATTYPIPRSGNCYAIMERFLINKDMYVSSNCFQDGSDWRTTMKNHKISTVNAILMLNTFLPQRGDIVVLDSPDNYHVGIVTNAEPQGNNLMKIFTVEGNTDGTDNIPGKEYWETSRVALKEYTYNMRTGEITSSRYYTSIVGFGRIR